MALRAGVSVATASRSLRGVSKVAPGTRGRVLDAAQELSYGVSPRPLGGQAGGRGQRTVAVIVPFITRWYFATATAAAVDHLRANGVDVLLYHLGTADVRDHFFEQMPLAGRVDGIVSLSMPLRERHTLSLRALGLPLVSIGSQIDGWPSVGIDDVTTTRLAVNHLLNQSHERIGLITGRPDDTRFEFASSLGRRLGYEEALDRAGHAFDARLVAEGPHGIEGGAVAMAELLARPRLPTAVICEFDELAIGALWALRKAGFRVPGDVSVVGIDNIEMAPFVDLTTVAQDVVAQGQDAARLLLQLLDGEGETNEPQHLIHPTRLVLRGSTAPPRRSVATEFGQARPFVRPSKRHRATSRRGTGNDSRRDSADNRD